MKLWNTYKNIGGIIKNSVLLLKNIEINYF